MQVSSGSLTDEVRDTVDAAVAITNAVRGGGDAAEIHQLLVDHGFQMAVGADETEIGEAFRTLSWLAGLVDQLADAELAEAVQLVNRALAGRAVAPSINSHDGLPAHIHWTQPNVPLGGRVLVDVLMGLAQTICDDGVERFGRCEAQGCDSVYFDTTKNRSRRFCSDPRCASRTHTANHRARTKPSS